MTDAPRPSPEARTAQTWLRCGLGLGLTPCAVALAERVLPHVHLRPLLAYVVAFVGAAAFPILGLAVAATAEVALAGALAVAGPTALLVLVLAWHQPSASATLVIVDGALVALAWSL